MEEYETHTHWIASSGREGGGAGDGLFPYWSFTKTAISISALKLVEARALDLDAPVNGQPFSLRQLLAHTSDLPDYGQSEQYHAAIASQEAPWARDELLDIVLRDGLLFEPGEGWSYSNIGYLFVRELIEEKTAMPLGSVISDMICKPLGLATVELATSREQFARLHWDAAADYDPQWIYHGCLTGTASDASRLLHALLTGRLLRSDILDQMLNRRPLGGPVPGRPWTQRGYALGLMSGAMGGAGTAIGHSGGGPFSVNAVYHFPDTPDPITVACFTEGTNVGIAELEATKFAGGR